MKMGKIVGWGILVVAILVFTYLVWKKKITIPTVAAPGEISPGGTGTGAGSATNTTSGANTNSNEFPLKSGSQGDKVKKIQSLINYLIDSGKTSDVIGISRPSKLAVDGIFGANTENGARYFFGLPQITETLYNALMISYNGKI